MPCTFKNVISSQWGREREVDRERQRERRRGGERGGCRENAAAKRETLKSIDSQTKEKKTS